MTPDYNDGKWRGWNGGECPVHPESEIEWLWHDENRETNGRSSGLASKAAWRGQVLKFRVTKAYVEPPKPREFWILDDENEEVAVYIADPRDGRKFIHVREVLE